MSPILPAVVSAWGTPGFEAALKSAIEALDPADLPLQAGLCHSSAVANEPFRVRLIAARATPEELILRLGVFYAGVVAGCSCADDPTPPGNQTEYCELDVRIDRVTARADIALRTTDP